MVTNLNLSYPQALGLLKNYCFHLCSWHTLRKQHMAGRGGRSPALALPPEEVGQTGPGGQQWEQEPFASLHSASSTQGTEGVKSTAQSSGTLVRESLHHHCTLYLPCRKLPDFNPHTCNQGPGREAGRALAMLKGRTALGLQTLQSSWESRRAQALHAWCQP